MKLRQTIQNTFIIASLSITLVFADDCSEFNIEASSPMDADFFDNDIPASYLSSNEDKTAQNYAIIESGPTETLMDNEIYIENLPVAYDSNINIADQNSLDEHINNNPDLYAAAGTFIDDSGEVSIPENLVMIESFPQTKRSDAIGVTSSNMATNKPHTAAGEFVADETNGVTAETDEKDKYTALPAGSFSIGYQMMYMHYNEEEAACETIYNGIMAEYTYIAKSDIFLKASTSLLGGAVFNKDNGTVYSDTTVTFGRRFQTDDGKLSISPYLGLGLRYMNNVFAGNGAIERNTLQLYIPVGLRFDFKPSDNFKMYSNIEAGIIGLNQNWTTYNTGYDSTTASFNGFSASINLGTEYKINNSMTLGISPYYQYIYTGKKSGSPVGHTDTHMIGLNAFLKF